METHYDRDPSDNTFESVYVFLIMEGNELRVEVDRHTVGAFELEDFLGAIRRAGFSAAAERWELSEWGDEPELPSLQRYGCELWCLSGHAPQNARSVIL